MRAIRFRIPFLAPLPEREGLGVGSSQDHAAPAPGEPTPAPSLSGREGL